MIPPYLAPLANHLWQSTLFAAAAGLLTMTLRANRAPVRYWLWLAASVKFLVPFSLLVSLGNQFDWRPEPVAAAIPLSTAIQQVSHPFAALDVTSPPTTAHDSSRIGPMIVFGVWLGGFLAVAISCDALADGNVDVWNRRTEALPKGDEGFLSFERAFRRAG